MDNKRWSKKFSTIFWWVFGLLPLLVAIIQFIGYHLTFNSGISSATDLAQYHNDTLGQFFEILGDNLTSFNNWNVPFITTAWSDLFDVFNLTDSTLLVQLLSWLTFSFFIHVIFDIVVWLPKFMHSLLCKYEV